MRRPTAKHPISDDTRRPGPRLALSRGVPRPSALLPFLLLVGTVGPACRTAGLDNAWMSLDESGDRHRTTFYTDTANIYCIGQVDSGTADVSVSSIIRASSIYQASLGTYVPADATVAVSLQDQAPGQGTTTVAFQLLKATPSNGDTSTVPFVPGKYECDLYVNGDLDRTVPFDIEFPDCPVAPPSDGGPCAEWVPPGAVCPGAEAGVTCTCGADPVKGTWSCTGE
jgi:hypothetical protein